MPVSTLSDLTNVPKDTINNILYRKTKNPSFEAVTTLLYALNGSIDRLQNGVSGMSEVPASMTDTGEIIKFVSRGWMQATADAKAHAREEQRAKRV